MGEMHTTLIVVASICVTDCAETFANGNEQLQSFNETGNVNEVTTNVNLPPPYALEDAGENEARKGASDASRLNEKFATPAPSRSIHIASDFIERLKAGGSVNVTTADELPVFDTLKIVALVTE